jgi:hypothetical protein
VRIALNLLVIVITLTACAPGMRSFQLPDNVASPALDAHGAPGLTELSGVWRGTWFTPDWGLGYDALLLVERLDQEQATVLYAWSNPALGADGWYRQKARVIPGPGLEWTRGTWTFTLQLDPDRASLAGTTVQAASRDKAFITMKRTPFAAPPPSRPSVSASLPRLPAEAKIWVPAEVPLAAARWFGIWEGTWDSGIASRLVVRGITQGKADIVYEWSTHPQGERVNGFRRLADVRESEGTLTWGQAPTLTFRVSADGQTLQGEWEREGMVSLATLRKVSPE